MKRAMILIVMMVVLLFSQLAFAEWEFHTGELREIWEGEVQDQEFPDQEVAAAGFKIVPLQIYTHRTVSISEMTWPWYNLDQEFYTTVSLRLYGSGEYKCKLTITDLKTGVSKKFNYGVYPPHSEGQYWFTYGHLRLAVSRLAFLANLN